MELEQETQPSFFEIIGEGDEHLCRALWLGVILQAILDAKGRFGNVVSRNQARVWLQGRGNSESDFAAVCNLAGVDFEKTRRRCAELLEDDSIPIDFRAMKRDQEKNRTSRNRRRYFHRARRRDLLRGRLIMQAGREPIVGAHNDNLPQPANDNIPQTAVTNFNNQPEETNHE